MGPGVLQSFFFWLLALSLPTGAESPVPAANPADIHFEVRIRKGVAEFKLGELIPIELLFTSSSPKKYQVDLSGGRHGSGDELFPVEPEIGWSDPAGHLMQPSIGACGGCLHNSAPLTETPVSVQLTLNLWVRFHRPGRYRLRAETFRVSRISERGFAGDAVGLKSSAVELKLVPANAAWQERTLRQALAVVDTEVRSVAPIQEALETLDALGTDTAAREMARRLRGNDYTDSQFARALIGSPRRQTVLEEMERLLSDPDHPVTRTFLNALSRVETADADAGSLMERRRETDAVNRARLLDVLPQKRGAARITSLVTALEAAPDDKDTSATLLQKLVAVFDQLPPREQRGFLEYRWDKIKGPGMLPVLRRLARSPADTRDGRARWDDERNAVSGEALRRWYELEPEAARDAVIQEIVRPWPRFGAETLGLLPDATLPEADRALAENLRNGETDASLLQRYATAAAVPEAVEVLDARLGSWACAPQASLLAYLLRVDPALAQPRIETVLALRDKHGTRCYAQLLTAIGKLRMDPLLTEIAVRSLADRDLETANDAARFLTEHGPASAEERLWQRYEQWCDTWHGREEELRDVPGDNPTYRDVMLGESLARALVAGPGWLADEAKLERIRKLAVGESVRHEAEWPLTLWRRQPWTISYDGSMQEFRLLQYKLDSFDALKQKLAQFRPGSTFSWHANPRPQAAEGKRLLAELRTFLAGLGMELTPSP